MPTHRFPEVLLDISRNAVLIDTNVLVAAFLPGEPEGVKDHAWLVLEEYEGDVLVPVPVIVEALGLIMGSRGNPYIGMQLLSWLNTPGHVTIVPAYNRDLSNLHNTMERLSVDCVDAMLAELATALTTSFSLRPAMPIVTLDTPHYRRMSKKLGFRISTFDLKDLSVQEVE
jgi:predicted nucleic acid-binding protein